MAQDEDAKTERDEAARAQAKPEGEQPKGGPNWRRAARRPATARRYSKTTVNDENKPMYTAICIRNGGFACWQHRLRWLCRPHTAALEPLAQFLRRAAKLAKGRIACGILLRV